MNQNKVQKGEKEQSSPIAKQKISLARCFPMTEITYVIGLNIYIIALYRLK